MDTNKKNKKEYRFIIKILMSKITTKKLIINDKEYTIHIGRNAIGNDTLVKKSNKTDLWFHLENESSPHIVLVINESKSIITNEVIRNVGIEMYNYKKSHDNVIYTEIKNVSCTKIPGTVYTKNIKILKYF